MKKLYIHSLYRIALFIATVGHVGYLPKAPGTWGSVAGIFLFLCVPFPWMTWAIPLLFFMGWGSSYYVLSTHSGVSFSNSKTIHEDRDPSFIVVDEVVGMWLTFFIMMWWMEEGLTKTPLTLSDILVGFVLFRIFDILKPFPIRHIDHYFHNKKNIWAAFGIMIDDVLAALIAGILSAIICEEFF
jgi:phosphatidylglycerophosphatase A